ncbi:MAG TPA: serine/threonine-protein kinase, partial [Gemmatimonadaceae bacterium]|nr:serine/threonine-protein kinase [Gemmatimonadaceae bacterium]
MRWHGREASEALRLAREVASALDYAHRQGVVHRDIEPENVLLQDGQVLVAEFGIALTVESAAGPRLTGTGLSLGTPQYVAPEQAMGERAIDARADVYALGAITYEMLAGEPPFTGPNVQAIVARVLTERPRPLRAIRDTVPAAVLGALAKLPADRPQSAAAFAAALGSVGTALGAVDAPPARPAGTGTPRTARLRLAGALAGVAILAGVAGWYAARSALARASDTAMPLLVTSIVPPAGYTLAERNSIAMTPDGRTILMVLIAPDGSRALWRRSLDRDETEMVPGTMGADVPFWSPDGRSFGYFARGSLWTVEGQGEQRQLCRAAGTLSASWGTPSWSSSTRSSASSTWSASTPCRSRLGVRVFDWRRTSE